MYKVNDRWIMKITDVKEYRVTEELQGHPNIVSMLPMSRRSGKYASVVMEYCEGGNLCLLYTSPSPRDAHESRMPSSA